MNITPKLTELENDISLNPELFARVKAVYDQRKKLKLDEQDMQLLEDTYKALHALAPCWRDGIRSFIEYSSELSQLTLKFGRNARDCNKCLLVQHHRPRKG